MRLRVVYNKDVDGPDLDAILKHSNLNLIKFESENLIREIEGEPLNPIQVGPDQSRIQSNLE